MGDPSPNRGPAVAALVPRTAALFILLYQLRLVATDMADTPVFAAALAGALLSAVFLCRIKINRQSIGPVQAVIIMALVPWTIRFFIALPRWFIAGASDTTIVLDSLLLNFDRNNFTALLPFYWVAFTSYFSMRSRLFLRADIIAADTFFLVLFSITPTASMEVYRWPILMIGLFALVLFLQIISLILSIAPELKLRRREGIMSGAFLFLLVVLSGALFIRPFQERAVERGGGLLEPKLFRFDFSQVLRLESEISVNDDLVMIVKKDPDDSHVLLRRYTLSGYSRRQGFFRIEDIDEAAHPQRLPSRRTQLPAAEIADFRESDQEYYLVNFDSSAFIGMNMPVEVIPFETWDASSFNSAYAVRSYTSEAAPYELIRSVSGKPGPESFKMSAAEYALYTDYGGDEAIADYAREIVRDYASYFRTPGDGASLSAWEQAQMILYRLKYGEYRYSLKPGIAPDGDQLKYFLFAAKKGYCTYYAFAFTLMLRSLGIPCRVAAGFFVDPSTETFNYHPVRTDMAHAWVEVWFPGYGWIEFDPTSESLAEGEEFRFSEGTPPELFERLMKEILENHSRLREKEGEETESGRMSLAALGRRTFIFLKKNGPPLVIVILALVFLTMRCGYLWLSFLAKNQRKKALYLWAHVRRRLALAALARQLRGQAASAEAEWAKDLDDRFSGLYSLYLDSAAAAFAPVYTSENLRSMAGHYRSFCTEYRKALPLWRRLLAWFLPPLALVIRNSKSKSSAEITGAILLLIFLFTLRGAQAQDALRTAEQFYESALAAQNAENWERAIELFNAGAKLFPLDFRFPWSLGTLYYNRSLYRLAWDEFRRADKIFPWDTPLLMRLANTAGYLNMNGDAAEYLERLLNIEPDDTSAIGSLAWMYFKLHRLPEGERLLLDAIERLGSDADFSMTLATIYSDMFMYSEAKDSYHKAIKSAENSGDRLFAALAYYNLSILESRFYEYSLAYDCTNASLESMNRASGRLARGELYLRRMELPRAFVEYQEAYSMDSSPLSKLNLAEAYQIGGRLTEAVLYANDCLKAKDQSWMLNYGIDPVRYKRDIHEILKNSYEGLFNAEAFFCPGSFKERVESTLRRISYKFRFKVHTHLFRKYNLLSADAYEAFSGGAAGTQAGETHLEALIQYFHAFESYPGRALAYTKQARAFEEPIIPASAPAYDYEEGRILKNRKLLEETLDQFDPTWERDMIADVYTELARIGKKAERRDAAERLFAINRGALLRNGIRLPVDLRFGEESAGPGSGTGGRLGGTIKKAVKAAGFEPVKEGPPRYTLTFSQNIEGSVSCELYDGGRGITVFASNLPLPSSHHQRAAFARYLRDGIFNAF